MLLLLPLICETGFVYCTINPGFLCKVFNFLLILLQRETEWWFARFAHKLLKTSCERYLIGLRVNLCSSRGILVFGLFMTYDFSLYWSRGSEISQPRTTIKKEKNYYWKHHLKLLCILFTSFCNFSMSKKIEKKKLRLRSNFRVLM